MLLEPVLAKMADQQAVHPVKEGREQYLTYRQQNTEQQRRNLGVEDSRIVFQLRSQGIFPGLERVASHLDYPGSLRKPDMRKLLRELCQAGRQGDGVTDDPLCEMEA